MKKILRPKYTIILIIFLGLILRLITINQSLWLDEAIGVLVVREQNYTQILTQFPKGDNHPPLYYLTLKGWTDIFGYSELALRSLSIVFGLLTILFIYKIANLVFQRQPAFSKRLALFASLLTATSGFHIYYSQEARMYSMTGFFASLAIYSFVKITKEVGRKEIKPLWWIIFSSAITLLIFTDYVPVFLLPVFWLYAITQKLSKRWWARFILSYLPLVVLGLLWLPLFLFQTGRGSWMLATLPAWRDLAGGATFKQAALVWTKFTLGRISFNNKFIYYPLIVVSSLPLILSFVRAWISRERVKILWFWLAIPLLVGFAVSFWFPAFIYFRFVFIVPAFYLLVSFGSSEIKTDRLRLGLFSLLIFINLAGWLVYVFDTNQQREQWREAVSFIEGRASDSSLVVFDYPEGFAGYRWYEAGVVDTLGGTDSISASSASYEKVTRGVIGYEDVYYFNYLYDLTDPNQYVERAIVDSGFVLREKYSQFHGVGSISYYTRK